MAAFDLDDFNMLVTDDDATLEAIEKYIMEHSILTYVDPDTQKTILHLAVIDASPERLEYLLEKGANIHINAKDNDGNTPLHIAAESIKVESVPVLLKYGADKSAMNNSGFTPFNYVKVMNPALIYQERVEQFQTALDVGIISQGRASAAAAGGMRRTRRRKATRRSRAKSRRQRKTRRY